MRGGGESLGGKYDIFDAIGAGATATVHVGRAVGAHGFERTVAVKKLHPHLAKDPDVVASLLEEARIAARVHHTNVATTLDVVVDARGLFVVLEYVHGATLSALARACVDAGEPMPWRVAVSIVAGVLRGLHAAHEAKDEKGRPFSLVHRDVSPQNVLVGADGVARVVDFGIAKATSSAMVTRQGLVKGKPGYMAPEQVLGEPLDRRTDVYAAGIVLWEAITGERLFHGTPAENLERMLAGAPPIPLSPTTEGAVPPELGAIVARALEERMDRRFPTAVAMATALDALGPASPADVGAWVEKRAGVALAERAIKMERTQTMPATMRLESSQVGANASLNRLRRGQRARRVALAALGVAVVAAAGGVALHGRARVAPAEAPAPSAFAAPAEPSPPASIATVVRDTLDVPDRAKAGAPSPGRHAPPRRGPRGNARCNPPFVIDANGHKHFLPECI
jgi:eukaryotic-like serine/threonine-protein kinase